MTLTPSPADPLSTLDPWLHELQDWIACESPSADTAAVTRMMELVARRAQAKGLRTESIQLAGTPAPALLVSNRAAGDDRAGILIIGHLDTVHPAGTLARNGWRCVDDRLYGPGIYDMKAGVYLALEALGELQAAGGRTAVSYTHLTLPTILLV